MLTAGSSNGQDIHFSQFGMSNLTLNPATTGVMTCNARFSLVYRNQWASVAGRYAFNTFGFGGEAKFNAGKMISMVLVCPYGVMLLVLRNIEPLPHPYRVPT